MEVLVVGNTAYVDDDFCAKAFPGDHVKVVAAKDARRDESSPHASWKELLQHLEQAYEFDRVVYLSNYLTPHTDTVGDIELLRSVFRACAGRRVQLLYVAGPAGAEGAADAAGRTIFLGAPLLAFRRDWGGHVSRFVQSSSSSDSVCCCGLPMRFAGRVFLGRGCG